MSLLFAIEQGLNAWVLSCPRCALGQQAWLEVRGEHFATNALAVAAPFLAILLLVNATEPYFRSRDQRQRTGARLDPGIK